MRAEYPMKPVERLRFYTHETPVIMGACSPKRYNVSERSFSWNVSDQKENNQRP